MMDHREIHEIVRRSIVEVDPRLEGTPFNPETTLAQLKLDSLKLIEVGVRLEDAFGDIRFDNWLETERAQPEAEAFKVGSLVSFIEKSRRV
jgi:acyl carrier protein